MDPVRIIEIKKSVFADNQSDADALRAFLKQKGVYLLNLMSSPGSGKTTTLIQTITLLKEKILIAVMVAAVRAGLAFWHFIKAVHGTHRDFQLTERLKNQTRMDILCAVVVDEVVSVTVEHADCVAKRVVAALLRKEGAIQRDADVAAARVDVRQVR